MDSRFRLTDRYAPQGDEERGTARYTAPLDDFSFEESVCVDLFEFIAELENLAMAVPEEHRPTARFYLKGGYDGCLGSAQVWYERPETDDEMACHAKKACERQAAAIEEARRRELATLAALKAKYEQ